MWDLICKIFNLSSSFLDWLNLIFFSSKIVDECNNKSWIIDFDVFLHHKQSYIFNIIEILNNLLISCKYNRKQCWNCWIICFLSVFFSEFFSHFSVKIWCIRILLSIVESSTFLLTSTISADSDILSFFYFCCSSRTVSIEIQKSLFFR